MDDGGLTEDVTAVGDGVRTGVGEFGRGTDECVE